MIATRSRPDDRVLLIIEDDENFATDPARSGAREGLQGRRRRPGRHRPGAGADSSNRTRSRSTSSCPSWTAGACSIGSSTTRSTRHIPVHIISVTEERQRALTLGAIAYVTKPVTKEALDDAFAQHPGLRRAAR